MKTIGLARLGRDAEIRYTPSGEAVANLSLAFNYGKKGDDGNRPSQWIDASLWGARATVLAQFMLKGSVHCFHIDAVHIEEFTRGDGSKGTKLVGMISDVELGPRMDGAAPAERQAAPARQAPAAGAARPAPKPAPQMDDMDDIPF